MTAVKWTFPQGTIKLYCASQQIMICLIMQQLQKLCFSSVCSKASNIAQHSTAQHSTAQTQSSTDTIQTQHSTDTTQHSRDTTQQRHNTTQCSTETHHMTLGNHPSTPSWPGPCSWWAPRPCYSGRWAAQGWAPGWRPRQRRSWLSPRCRAAWTWAPLQAGGGAAGTRGPSPGPHHCNTHTHSPVPDPELYVQSTWPQTSHSPLPDLKLYTQP